ncbi:rho guanine nucleotide exchange factor TIAM1 isoform X2 [Thunnus maccoyii]|uniref:rho guanine nucleotide exchange factor TIAM1 isoform X2 n=1 Tax=Thunnus maccoyii TaxID=8240 RepID=UPI001C4C6538|nr:rho guanine nucleotide exchange factor TIAM1 isoform X2 [Thunnus maccoyii]
MALKFCFCISFVHISTLELMAHRKASMSDGVLLFGNELTETPPTYCLKVGDEILLLNGKPASALQMDDMRAAFVNQALTLSVSTLPQLDSLVLCSNPPRRSDGEQDLATDIFSQSQEDILDEVSGLTVESLDESLAEGPRLTLQSPGDHQEDKTCTGAEQKSTEQVTAFCRSLHDMNPLECPMSSSSSSSSSSLSPSPVSALPPTAGAATQRQLSHADKLRKVINELVETEKTYVKDLRCLIECYLTPLQKESFLTQDELDVLFGNLGEMVEFQVEFLRTLEDGIRLVPDLDRLERVEQFKKVLFSLGGSFLYYADRFKIYSAFCASHTKVPKVLTKAKTDPDFKAFLAERNPRQQHSSTLESYLIKPIQRVLKYPLLLKELYSLTDPDSEEHYHLDVAMKAMNKVASHINEMQKLHEEYGAVFDQLINEQTADKKEVADLSMGDLLLHSTVMWINPPASLVKSKKDPDLAAFVFKTAVVFVYKDCSKHRKKIGGSHRASVSDDKDPFRFRHMIATDSLQVRALANSEGTAVCEIVHTKSESEGRPERTFQLCCSSPDSKKDFLKAVHSILREKQRRQLLKTESLPPNQQYVPFGGKRLCALKGSRPTMNRAASAPSRSLARRKLVRNRFTIDTDLVFHGNNNNSNDSDPSRHSSYPSSYSSLSNHGLLQSHKPQGEDTDRWVEEQFDLGRYEDQGEGIDVGQVKETDILSDDDEYCKSVRAASSEPIDLEGKMDGLNLQAREARSHNLNGRVETGSEVIQGVMREDEVDRMKRGDDSGSVDSYTSCGVPLSRCATPTLKLAPLKQCAVEGAANKDHDVIWVRRDDFTNGCNSDVF